MSVLRRGACPTLGAPMRTGDGLLARLRPVRGGFAPEELAGLAEAAARPGNGILEVTGRASLQVRGLSEGSALALGRDVAKLGIAVREGLPVEAGPLAGLDPDETADPRPLVERIAERAGTLAGRLGPKVSVVVDGGGRIGMSQVPADLRLEAVRTNGEARWLLSVGEGSAQGAYDGPDAEAEVFRLLRAIAELGVEARGRDLLGQPGGRATPRRDAAAAPFVGTLPLRDGRVAISAALPFGQIEADDLARLARHPGAEEIRLGLNHTLFLLCAPDALDGARRAAHAAGLILDPCDPALRVSACAGAPACHAGLLDTKSLAKALASTLPPGQGRVHLSGCPKRCAEPPAAVRVVGGTDGVSVNGAPAVAFGHAPAAIGQALRAGQEQSAA